MADVTLHLTDEEWANVKTAAYNASKGLPFPVSEEEVIHRSLRSAIASPLKPPTTDSRGTGSLADFGDSSNC